MSERTDNLVSLAIFLVSRLLISFIIGAGILKILFTLNPMMQWMPGIGDGVSLITVGIFIALLLK
jgi:hypothetical protein